MAIDSMILSFRVNIGENDVRKISGIIQPEPHGPGEVLISGNDFVARFAEEDYSRFTHEAQSKLFDITVVRALCPFAQVLVSQLFSK